MSDVIQDIASYGDRPSSRLMVADDFKSFRSSKVLGQIRFVETKTTWIGANEPLTATENKSELFQEFCEKAKQQNKRAVLAPVTEHLAQALKKQGFSVLPIGVEAIFDLREYFAHNHDPLIKFPAARALKRKGATVAEISKLTPELKLELEKLTEHWHTQKGVTELGFLNRMDPFFEFHQKRLFLLKQDENILAFLTALPYNSNKSVFFSEYARHPNARVGSMELLFIETMRMLMTDGYETVSLGLSPLAKTNNKVFEFAFSNISFPYPFKSVFDFKNKFEPSRWEPLFLVSSSRLPLKFAKEFFRLTYPEGFLSLFFKKFEAAFKPEWRVSNYQIPLHTLTLNAFFVLLHYLRSVFPNLESLYAVSGYQPANVTGPGLFLGPFFHNTQFHLWGDILSFILFGAMVEIYAGRRVFWLLVGAGLWLSNPLTHLFLATLLPVFSSQAYAHFMTESDYGSSNALYAIIGGLGYLMVRPRNILLPFTVFAIYINFAKSSWIALHHLIAIGMGYTLIWCLRRYK